MKLTVSLLLVCVLQLSASVYSQNAKLSIQFKNGTVKEVLKKIEDQSDYRFFYNEQFIDLDRKINVSSDNGSINSVLDEIFEGANVSYKIMENNLIIITPVEGIQKNVKISGKVTDSTGEPLPGVTVVIKGTTNGAITNFDGVYSLSDVPSDAIIQFSFVGMRMQEVEVAGKTSINVVLEEDAIGIEEVVAVGYGTQKKRDVIGSIATVQGDDITKIPTTNLAENLQGMVSGMMVTNTSGHPGTAPEIKIRGLNSINLSTNPLWIIDGIPIFTGSTEKTTDGVKGVSAISMINPNDIESIEVLKDAAATAIYGNRGSSGVILVTTKSNKGKLTGVQLNYDAGVSQLPFDQSDIFVDSKTWWNMMETCWENIGITATPDPQQFMTTQFLGERPLMTREEAEATNTDQLKELTQNSFFHQIGLTANKGFETGGVTFSFNYRNEKGLIRNNDFDRLTSRINFNFKPLESLEMGIATNFIYLKTNGVRSQGGKGGAGWNAWKGALPWYKVYDENSSTGYWAANSGYNMRAFSDRKLQRYDVDQYRNIDNVFVQWETPLKGLKIRGEAGVDVIVNNNSFWRSALLVPIVPQVSSAFEQSVTKANMNFDIYANYNRTFKDIHNIDMTVGWEGFRNWSYIRYAEGQNLQTTYPELINPLNMISMSGRQGGDHYLMGIFARANYKLLDRYIINASIRRDGHSAFNEDNRWANFYAFGVGWIMTDEEFMKNIHWLDLLKLRGSYGITGNSSVSNSMTYTVWGLDTKRIFGVNYLPGATNVGPIGSSGLKWETTTNIDFGFDFGLFDNRINGSFAYYTQDVSDLILRGNVQPSVGYTNNQIYENVGDLENRGFEFNVSSINIKTKEFIWKTSFNISTNKNKIISLNEAEKGKGNEEKQRIRKVGEALNTWYLANNLGVDPERGVYMIEERDADIWNNEYQTVATGNIVPMTNNNVANNKMVQQGKTPLPRYYGGLSNTVNYKGFDLNIMINFAGGHWIMNSLYSACDQMSTENNTIKDMVENSWEKPGDNAKYPLLSDENYNYNDSGDWTPTKTSFRNTDQTTRYLEKGDYIRLRNLQLGYTLPKYKLTNVKLNSVRVYVGVTNLFTITGFKGLDPETIDDLPVPRTINFGLSLNL